MKLTDKQKRFVDEYLIDLNATAAAIRAGYSRKTANRIGQQNLSKLDIRSAIDSRMAEKESALIAGQDEVLRFLTAILRGEESEEVPMFVGDGEQRLRDKQVGAKDRLKAAELLGKRYGLYEDKLSLSGGINVNNNKLDDIIKQLKEK